MTTTLRAVLATALACLALSGCHVNTNHNGNKENVDIGTPFGSMKVNTDKSADTTAIGITAYPGATPVYSDSDSHGNNADVNLSFGSFHLGVKAASFQTPDAPDKVLAFYRKDLAARYGDVIECQGHTTVGQPARTGQGLTCSDNSANSSTSISTETGEGGIKIKKSVTTDDLQLRAGSPTHQHIVGAESHNGGTKIGLVALDLPSHLSNHNGKDVE